MAKLCFLALCCLLLHTTYGLQCYNCVSTPANKNCDTFDDKSKIAISECGRSVAGKEFVTACLTKVIEDKTTKVQNTTRACMLTKNDQNPRECEPGSDRINVISCSFCPTDLCNTASIVNVSTFALFCCIVLMSCLI